MEDSTKKRQKSEKKKKTKGEKKDKSDRKAKERRRRENEEENEADPHDDSVGDDASSKTRKRRKLLDVSPTIAVSDNVADVKSNPDIGRGGDADVNQEEIPASAVPSNKTKENLDAIRKAKRERRKVLAAQLPTRDENGIAYTKLQLRRMRKRLERGLNPIETPQEAAERGQREAEMRREEQAELAGLLYQGKEDRNEDLDGEEDEDDGGEEQGDGDGDGDNSETSKGKTAESSATASHPATGGLKKPRTKPIPPDYVCQACKNRHEPPHWIYDCVEKVTMRGTNQVSLKHGTGAQNPKNKVFVSGLPFDVTSKAVTQWFADRCGAVSNVKVLTFDDSKRCRGQAFVTFENEDSVRVALGLTGTAMTTEGAAKKSTESSSKNGKELKLKVTKALNRTVTKLTAKSPGEKAVS